MRPTAALFVCVCLSLVLSAAPARAKDDCPEAYKVYLECWKGGEAAGQTACDMLSNVGLQATDEGVGARDAALLGLICDKGCRHAAQAKPVKWSQGSFVGWCKKITK